MDQVQLDSLDSEKNDEVSSKIIFKIAYSLQLPHLFH